MADSLDARYQRALDRRHALWQKQGDILREDQLLRKKTRAEKERLAHEEAAQARRDARLNEYDWKGTNQRAGIAADADYRQHGYTMQRDKQQTLDQLKRDAAQQGYTLQRDDRQFNQQMQRDAVQQDYTLNRDDRQQGNLLQRDAIQQGYGVENDDRRFGQQVQRDVMQDQFTTKRDRSQQQDLLQRDQMQFGQQTFRDRQQNDFQAQRDERLQGYGVEDDARQFDYQQQRDERLQGFDQQNAVQRETADIRAKWMDQVMQQRNNGFEFSPKQQHEMKQMEETFLRQVLNDPNLDEGMKQQAMRQYQMKLAGFIPNEKVVTPDQELQQARRFDPETNSWWRRGIDSQGRPDWEPIGTGGGQQQQQKEDPKIAMQREAMFEREKEFQKIADKIAAKVDPETGEPLYSDEEIDDLAMKQFAPMEQHYRNQYGLPPQAKYQAEADLERQKMEQKRNRDLQRPSQYDVNRPQQANPQPQPAATPPVLSSRGSLSPDVTKQLQALPGGTQLQQIREKYNSNSVKDQIVTQAANIVINAMLTKDTSDPDFRQSIEILSRAGFKLEQ